MTKEELKQSLNIPNTEFAMKIDHYKVEQSIQEWWNKQKIYDKVLLKNKDAKQKILHDGPPYANGKVHIGHALNKILKDIIVRHWNMEGYYSPLVMGWDVHGLPIEHALIKKGINTNKELTIIEKRDNCLNFANENVLMQKEQFRQLGIFTNYDKYYTTADGYIEFNELKLFGQMIKDNLIYKALKPVYWSWSSQSALAEDEIEYYDDESDSIYVSFKIADKKYDDTSLLIWTTTPWTIPSNLAVAVNPRFDYVQILVENNNKYIVSKTLLNKLKEILNWKEVKILAEIKGKDLENINYFHPLYNEEKMLVILADYVSDENGTGLVHNAPAFGLDDYNACLKYGIGPDYCPINNYGKFDDTVKSKELVGVFYKDANPIIIQKLKSTGNLLKADKLIHSVAFDWRTKKPVIYRATAQWFIDLDKIRNNLVESVTNNNIFYPNGEWAKKNLAYMVGHRSEWCISRQRYWGVPITIIYDENNQPILDHELISHIIDLIIEAKTSNIWFSKPVEYFLTDKYKNTNKKYYKETDIMDVWFDSGSSHNMFEYYKWSYPVELYIEGVDQFRGWFNSSTITGVILHDEAPFKTLISHGFVLDESGNKMSKSLGNVVDPEIIAKKYGTDIFRLWVASSNWMEDVRIGDNILKQVAENYRRIRNTLFRYTISNLYDFNKENLNINTKNEFNLDPEDYIASLLEDGKIKLELEDLYVLKVTENNIKKIKEYFDKYNFIDIVKIIVNTTNNLSNWYFDIIKDVLYCDKKDSFRRRQIQITLYEILKVYMITYAAFLPHTTEELYQVAKKMFNWDKESIFLVDYIKTDYLSNKYDFSDVNENLFKTFFELKDLVYSELEKLRANKIINKNNEAIVKLPESTLTKEIGVKKLREWLNVADVIVDNEFEVIKAENYHKCIRCWNYYKEELNSDELCSRCASSIDK